MDRIYSRYRIRMPKINNKKHKKIKKIYFRILLYTITTITSCYALKSVDPIFEGLCKAKAASIATDITNRKSSEVLAQYNYKETVEITTDENGNNKILKTDVVLLNEMVSDISGEMQKELDELENQNIEIPIGALTGNKYLAGFGPKVKIRIIPASDIATEIKTEFKSAGINQTVYRIYMEVECNVSILTAYKTINHTIKNQVLLVETVIVGGIPETYLNFENK